MNTITLSDAEIIESLSLLRELIHRAVRPGRPTAKPEVRTLDGPVEERGSNGTVTP